MSNIRRQIMKWCEGKPLLLAINSIQSVDIAQNWDDMSRRFDQFTKYSMSRIPLREWLRFYWDHRMLADGFSPILVRIGLAKESVDLTALDWWRAFNRLSEEQRRLLVEENIEEIKEEFLNSCKREKIRLEETIDEILGKHIPDNGNVPYEDIALLTTPAMTFALRIMFPCWVHYGQHPGKLYASARRGNLDSLEKLITLDKAVLADPFIARRFQESQVNGRTAILQDLSSAIVKNPPRLNHKRIKMVFAGFISRYSMALGSPIEEPEIRRLFDLYAQMRGIGRIDTDLPVRSDTFYTAIRRHRLFWTIIPLPDKNSPPTCPGKPR